MKLTMVRNLLTNEDNLHRASCKDLHKVRPDNILATFENIEDAKKSWADDDSDDVDGWSWVVVMPCAK